MQDTILVALRSIALDARHLFALDAMSDIYSDSVALDADDIKNFFSRHVHNLDLWMLKDNLGKEYLSYSDSDRSDLPPNSIDPGVVQVYNTAKCNAKHGKHWVCYMRNLNGQNEFFDSYGDGPSINGITALAKTYIQKISSDKFQADGSGVCGQYVTLYAWFKSRNRDMKKELDLKSSDSNYINEQNDMAVKKCYAQIVSKNFITCIPSNIFLFCLAK